MTVEHACIENRGYTEQAFDLLLDCCLMLDGKDRLALLCNTSRTTFPGSLNRVDQL